MPPISRAGRTEHQLTKGSHGYTYVTLLLVLVVLALAAQTTWVPQKALIRRELEKELIFRGLEYRDAIKSYWLAGGEAPAFPDGLESLLSDPRFLRKRHIRRLYEPVFGTQWRLIRAEGRIIGVAPDFDGAPARTSNFPVGVRVRGEGAFYSDWEFIFQPEEGDNR